MLMELLLAINIFAGLLLIVGVGRLVWLYRSPSNIERTGEAIAETRDSAEVVQGEGIAKQYATVKPTAPAKRTGSFGTIKRGARVPVAKAASTAVQVKGARGNQTEAAAKLDKS